MFHFEIVIIVLAAVLGLVGTLLVEHFAPRLRLVQIPNERSSHTLPTPRGGGVAIAVSVIVSCIALGVAGSQWSFVIALATLCIGALGFTDDLRDLSPALRFPIQAAVLIGLVAAMGDPLPITISPTLSLGGWLLAAILVIAGLWWLNLYNFMDGIDGIAATHAILVLLGAVAIWLIFDPQAAGNPIFWLAIATACAALGFLVRNWPPAHIFMGDAGSNALAVVVFAVALKTVNDGILSYPVWIILPAVFVSDATVTLLRRMSHGERPWRAHRRHAYQQMSRRFGHAPVTVLYSAATAFWSVPLAGLSEALPNLAWIITILAYGPLVVFAAMQKGGAPVETTQI